MHGQELPKFLADSKTKEWWKFEQKERPKPKFQSRVLLKQGHKYWAKNDEMLIADTTTMPGPTDQFKLEHIPKAPSKEVPEKPTRIMPIEMEVSLGAEAEHQRGYQPKERWSRKNVTFPNSGRMMDIIVEKGMKKEAEEIERMKKVQEYLK